MHSGCQNAKISQISIDLSDHCVIIIIIILDSRQDYYNVCVQTLFVFVAFLFALWHNSLKKKGLAIASQH